MTAVNPNRALTSVITGCLKRYVGSNGTFPELQIAPHLTQRGPNGQFQVLKTPLKYNAQKGGANRAGWDGRRGIITLDYDTVSTKLEPFRSDAFILSDDARAMLEAENPDLTVLDDGMFMVTEQLRGRLAEEVATAVAALTSGGTLDLTAASTNVQKTLVQTATSIMKKTGLRPNVFACGREAVDLLLTNNTQIAAFHGVATAPGATTGAVGLEALRRFFREQCEAELVVLDRSIINAAGSDAFQWSTTAFFGYAAGGAQPSCLKTCAPDPDVVKIKVGELGVLDDGPGTVIVADGHIDLVTVDAELGRKFTLTITG